MKGFVQALSFRLEYLLVLAARGLDRILGARRSDVLARALGRFVYRRLRIRADVVEDQLRHAYPEKPPEWIRDTAEGAYEHIALEAMRILRLSRQGPEAVLEETEVEGLESLRRAIARGPGAVLYSGHLGNWEVMAAALTVRGIPLTAVARKLANPLVDTLVNEARARLGLRIIFTGGALQGSLESLKMGHAVALVADQDARDRGVFVPFFGRPASTFRGPAVVAERSGAPLFIITGTRRPDGRFLVRLEEVELPEIQDTEARHQAVMSRLTAALEAAVREDPTQYLWQHRRWKTPPPKGAKEPEPAEDRDGTGRNDPGGSEV